VLAANFDRRRDVEVHRLLIFADVLINKVRNSLKFLLLDVAIQKQSSIVFVVVTHRCQLRLSPVLNARRPFNQLFQVLNQIVQLWYLDVPLNHIARIEVPDRLYVLIDRLLVALLVVIQVISTSLRDLSSNLGRKLSSNSDVLSLFKKLHLHQCLNLYVVFHFKKLKKHFFTFASGCVFGEVKYSIFFDLDLQNFCMFIVPKHSDVV
jgi:hypothetical protein